MLGLVGPLLLSLGLTPTLAAPRPASAAPVIADPHLAGPYFGARYYGAKTGRFTAVDPVYTWQENILDPQRWNRYAYGRNNPFRYVDPDGREL